MSTSAPAAQHDGPRRYTSIAAPVEAEIEIKRSRFLARLEPVSDEETARAVVEEERSKYWDARHHCSAFVLGPSSDVRRSSDDGEPSGTAGMPMLEVLTGRELTDVVAVVTRWFGGTLLGTGGLVRAYSEAVSAALDVATPQCFELRGLWNLKVPLQVSGKVDNSLRTAGVEVTGADYGPTHVALNLAVPAGKESELAELAATLTSGEAAPERVGSRWTPVRR